VIGPVIEQVSTIRPRPLAVKASRQACIDQTMPYTFVSKT